MRALFSLKITRGFQSDHHRFIIVLLMSLILGACGQKGDLVRPGKPMQPLIVQIGNTVVPHAD